ncbi:MAG: hypothetical protein BWY59_00454 [Verrucomicrobia bacterium ADurb.Bin345]|nr:MAG: hypothetical protein BWY59_00454 [Verrucomicrobia bacterium ADurb.Bin345]
MRDIEFIFGPARILGIEQLLAAVLVSFVLSMVIAAVYRWTYQGLSYSRSFVHTQVLASIVTCTLIMAIGNNLARGLGILGTLAIIRFRTPIRDPRDIIFLFACLAVGIASGAAVFSVAIVGTLAFCAAALFLHWSPFASLRVYEGLLRFSLPPGSWSREKVREALSKYCSTAVLVAMREAMQGEAIEFSYQVRLIDPTFHADLLDELRSIEDIADVNLLMHRATVEI